MHNRISDILLSRLSEFVTTQMGLHFPRDRWRDLERGIVSASGEFRFNNAESCIESLVSSPLTKNQIETLASHLTVGETYFFREKKSLDALESRILPELIRLRSGKEKRLRIWSAGCCTGEEPYSIAILLQKLIPNLKHWNITLLATDINPKFLRKAYEGVYHEWSFREAPEWVKEHYFKKVRNDRYEILPSIKNMVKFSYLNLVDDIYPSLLSNTNAMDIIFCRNVLMYFTNEQVKKCAQKFYHSLVNGGWFLVSPSETSQTVFQQFKTANFPDAFYYMKEANHVQPIKDFSSYNETQFDLPADEETVRLDTKEIAFSLDETLNLVNPEFVKGSETTENVNEKYTEATEPKSLIFLAHQYANEGKLVEALDLCRKAIEMDKLNPSHYFLLAVILQEHGRSTDAVNALNKVLYLDRKYTAAHYLLGNLLWQQGKIKESKNHFQNALALLTTFESDAVLPESGGMSVGRVKEIIHTMVHKEFQE